MFFKVNTAVVHRAGKRFEAKDGVIEVDASLKEEFKGFEEVKKESKTTKK